MDAIVPVDTADLVWAMATLCRARQVAFEPRLFLQQFPPPTSTATLLRAAGALGLRLERYPIAGSAPLRCPAVAVAAEGTSRRLAVVLAMNADACLVATRDAEPASVPRQEFLRRYGEHVWEGEVAEAAPKGEPGVVGARFGLGWFLPELARHRALWRDVLFASVVLQVIALATPLCTQVVIDKVVVHHTHATLVAVAIVMAIFVAFGAALGWARQALVLHAGNRIDAVLGLRVFEHLLRLPPRYFEQRPTGTLVARLQGIEAIRAFLTSAAAAVLLDLPFAVLFLAAMLWYSVPLALLAAGAIAVLALGAAGVTPLLRKRLDAQFHAGARNQAFLTEYVSAMETVKCLQLEPQLLERYARQLGEFLRASFASRQLANHYAVGSNALEQGLALAILCGGALLVMQGDGFTIGMLVAFQMFASRLVQPVMRLAGLWQEFQQAAIAVHRLGDLMDAPTEAHAPAPRHASSGAGAVEFDRVTFRYSPERAPVLSEFSLRLDAGACAALVGPSGSGKSTLARLLQGFYPAERGAIRIDGHDIRNLGVNELRVQFGVVPQETRLFSGTVWENLALAQPHATFDEIVEACRAAEIHEFIDRLPQGYHTPVGEHGAGLSGGQKQRIAIARALLKRPRILVFDEATANLDRETAEAFARTVNGLRGRVTMIFIAHHIPDGLAVDAITRLDGGMPPARA